MRRVLAIVIVAAVVVAIAWWIAALPGQISIVIAGTTIEASAPVMVLGLLVLVFCAYVLLRLLVMLVTLPGTTQRWTSRRARRGGDVAVTRALVALAAGDPGDARREARRARRLLGETPQTLLLAASAGRLAGREDEATEYFDKLTVRPDTAFLGYRGLLRQALDRHDYAEARVLAQQADAAHPGAAWLREERAKLAIRDSDFKAALALSSQDGQRAALGVAAAEAETDRSEGFRLARQAWKDDPALASAALAYASRLRGLGKERRARAVLRATWKLAPQPQLAAAMLSVASVGSERLRLAETLTAENPTHLESLLLMAESCLAVGDVAGARRHAEAARAAANQRRVWMLLAEIEEREPGDAEAVRNALRQAALADPDPEWLCTECGTSQAAWHAVCPACGTTGKMKWLSGPPHWHPKTLSLTGPGLTPGLS
jgi:HemY protein